MKFVKGDVIASARHHGRQHPRRPRHRRRAARHARGRAALKRYGLLTIGDGLVSQIPALVLSTAAGILVTRVASEEPDHSLGERARQPALRHPQGAAGRRASSCWALGAVPGLPAVPFLVIAALLFVRGPRTNVGRCATTRSAPRPSPRVACRAGRDAVPSFVPMVVPWSHRGQRRPRAAARRRNPRRTSSMRRELFGTRQRPARASVRRARRSPARCRACAPPTAFRARHVVISLFEVPAKVVRARRRAHRRRGHRRRSSEAALALLRARAADFLGIAETQLLLDQLEQLAPAMVRRSFPSP